MSLSIRRLSYALGIEVLGLDLRESLDASTRSELHAAFLEHSLLLFRNQRLTKSQHLAFSACFGALDSNDVQPDDADPDYPEILLVTNKPKQDGTPTPKFNNEVWHSDRSFTLVPAMASLLRGVEVPDVGGDTMFANMYTAYETLSAGMKKLIDDLHGVYFGGPRRVDNSSPDRQAETLRLNPPIAQPVVRVHPETGRKSLYVGEKVKHFVGMTQDESRPLIEFLVEHATRPQLVYRHHWHPHDLVMWDNRCTLHSAIMDYDESKFRHMERTTLKGTPSGYVYEGPVEYEGPRV